MTPIRFNRNQKRGIGSVLITALVLTSTACEDSSTQPSQVVASVNDSEITVHQVNQLLRRSASGQPNVTNGNGEQSTNAARRAVIDKLIEQELLFQQAQAQNLDRDPTVLLDLESARRRVLATAYLRRVAARGAAPSDAEVDAYYRDNPNLFSRRRVYQFSEIVLPGPPPNWPAFATDIAKADKLSDAVKMLIKKNINPTLSHNVVRPTEKLPIHLLPEFARHEVGDLIVYRMKRAVVIGEITAIRESPVDKAAARQAIANYLTRKRAAQAVVEEKKRLEGLASIARYGDFEAGTTSNASDGDPPSAQHRGAAPEQAGKNPPNDDVLTRGIKGLK